MVKNMSMLNYLVTKLKTGIITFINAVILANRSYNMDDYEAALPINTYGRYVVGENNISGQGTQHKLFVSKSTLIFCTNNMYVRFNSSANVAHALLANTWYEFKHDIREIYHRDPLATGTMHIHCEGVLPKESRIGA